MPRKVSILALSFLLLFLAAPGKASADSIDPVIKKMVAKYKKINAKLKDLSFAQDMVMTDPSGKSVTQQIKYYKKGKKYRMDMVMKMPPNPNLPPGMGEIKTIMIFDGKNKWAISSMTGKQNMGPPAKGDDSDDWWSSMNMENIGDVKAKLVGSDKVGGRDCYLIESVENGDKLKMWLDKNSFTQMKMETKNKEGSFQMLFSDHKKVGGLFEWPYMTTMIQNGKKMATIKVEWMKINTGLSSDLFDANKVKAPAGMNMREMMEKLMKQRGK